MLFYRRDQQRDDHSVDKRKDIERHEYDNYEPYDESPTDVVEDEPSAMVPTEACEHDSCKTYDADIELLDSQADEEFKPSEADLDEQLPQT